MELDGISHRDRQVARSILSNLFVTLCERYATAAIPGVGCAAAATSGTALLGVA
jgi:hypothetical protein